MVTIKFLRYRLGKCPEIATFLAVICVNHQYLVINLSVLEIDISAKKRNDPGNDHGK